MILSDKGDLLHVEKVHLALAKRGRERCIHKTFSKEKKVTEKSSQTDFLSYSSYTKTALQVSY